MNIMLWKLRDGQLQLDLDPKGRSVAGLALFSLRPASTDRGSTIRYRGPKAIYIYIYIWGRGLCLQNYGPKQLGSKRNAHFLVEGGDCASWCPSFSVAESFTFGFPADILHLVVAIMLLLWVVLIGLYNHRFVCLCGWGGVGGGCDPGRNRTTIITCRSVPT